MKGATFQIDGEEVPFEAGQTIMEAATAHGVYIPHLCHHPDFSPHGSCKVCTVKVNGRNCSACTMPASEGQEVLNRTGELDSMRLRMVQMLFVEGNHICPGCEKSGDCTLQGVGYHLGMQEVHYPHFYPARSVDASHPELILDLDRCILCALCVRASCEEDGKAIFGIVGRGLESRLVVNTESGRLADSTIRKTDRAATICPVGAILIKGEAFRKPIGERIYDRREVSQIEATEESE